MRPPRYTSSRELIILGAVCLCLWPGPGPGAQTQAEQRINLNTASVEELMRLPNVGPTIAARIVEHRRKHGPFKRPQDVIIIRGMSAKRYRQIAHLLRT